VRAEPSRSEVELVAGEDQAGLRLDAVLAAHAAVPSRAAAQRLIDQGRVTVDGDRRPKGHRVATGERIVAQLDLPGPAPEAPAAPHEIVFEDDQLIVVDKPAGVVVHPSPGHATGTLAQALAGRASGGPDTGRAGIVHRLDRDTSGLLVVAKTEDAHRGLQRLIRAREMRREYLALVEGRPDSERGTIDAPIGRDRSRRTVISARTDRPRAARTHFWRIEALPRTTLLGVRLETGRTHQVRAHLTAIGHPICGDRQYGGEHCGRRLGLSRQFLHSSRLMFRHPVSGEQIDCESKPPVDLRRALDAAMREPVSGGPDGG
jgi:23S rRNA pseudouridine1911/1915/1917 synthase